jgi:succinate---hydroxymethylglutarate CoA-transferase
LLADERFADPAARSVNREAMYAILDEIFATDTHDSWAERLRSLPAGPVLSVGEALEGDAVAARRLVKPLEHPKGTTRQLASVYRFSDTPVQDGGRAPLLGEHTAEVLGTYCGVDEARLEFLREAGVVG